MKRPAIRFLTLSALAAATWICNGTMEPTAPGFLIASAEARFGRPVTPVSYAGVARRTTRRAVTVGAGAPGYGAAPGVGAGGIGGPASGVGVRPGAGAGRAGVGVNLGGPVNRVGVR